MVRPGTGAGLPIIRQLLCRAVFLATSSGCLLCCSPLRIDARLRAVERAYSLSDKAARAFLGKYRSPVALEPCVEFLPDLVPQSSLCQRSSDFCVSCFAISY